MPMYEYECQSCHKRTEKIQKFSDAPLTVCPFCGGVLQKTITAPAVQFKGGGWYADGYGSAKKSSGDSSSASSGNSTAASSSSSEGGSASSPAAASTTPAASTAAPASSPAASSSSGNK